VPTNMCDYFKFSVGISIHTLNLIALFLHLCYQTRHDLVLRSGSVPDNVDVNKKKRK
jgi:hypothetical protein